MRIQFSLAVLAAVAMMQVQEAGAQSLPSLKLDPPPPVAGTEQSAAHSNRGASQPANDLGRLAASRNDANPDTGLSAKLGNDLHASIHMMGAAVAVGQIGH